ncbi:MAG: hypothetical protein LKE75_01250 [Lachnospiraceae bacterium]|jgi:hypothetical protein|nr:hypothetical protein [Lachnospiraceae bacterium]MCH4030063.1 hypothetical protein [Lachnospiraceae bacterium]MCH4070277.1 hypothetical protein [Lachnospiraceae bacterium]MCH4107789.1 hypothetical protein [Lachnospiraceae bacterium]MCI1361514.1 hypothetical protein [Lachnospiraceae bacterium]
MKNTREKKLVNPNKKIPRMVILAIFIVILFCTWFLDIDLIHLSIIDNSTYIRYLSYNIGNDFTIFNNPIIDDDPDDHNYFMTTVIPKTYTNNGIKITVNKNGSISVQGLNTGNTLRISLNENAQIFPAGRYYFSSGGNSIDNVPFTIEWSKSDTENNYSVCAAITGQNGYIECDGKSKYKCILVIPENCDISNGLTLFPEMWRLSETEIINEQDLPNNDNIPYLRSINPSEKQPFGKVFQIKRQDFYSLSDIDKWVFKRNLKYIYFPKYQYVSILFEDGTGIQFSDSNFNNARAGTMDSAGILVGETEPIDVWNVG